MSVLKFQRHSLSNVIADIEKIGPDARGVLVLISRKDGGAQFRISGFMSKGDMFTLCGMLDWVKADMMRDILIGAEPVE